MLTVILADVPPCWEPISSARDSAGRLSALCARLHTLQTFPRRFHGESPLSTDLPHVPRCWQGWVWLSAIPGMYKAAFGVLHRAPGASGSLWNPVPSQPRGRGVQGCMLLAGGLVQPLHPGLCGAPGSCRAPWCRWLRWRGGRCFARGWSNTSSALRDAGRSWCQSECGLPALPPRAGC